jgi:DNA (cytosine-5)-methyltransferase 1
MPLLGQSRTRAYYNEFDPFAADWLRNLIQCGLIPDGDVDERDIRDVKGSEIKRYGQVHLFAGIGGWAYALQLAGWGSTRPVWTGSCPCQPFSSSGKRQGNKDSRNLWSEMYRLIQECSPDTVFGEQVSDAIRWGWLDRIQTDLEAEDYSVGHCVLGAHSVYAPHVRHRLWWVANSDDKESRITRNSSSQKSKGLQSWTNYDGRSLLDYWGYHRIVICRDGKHRRIEPGTFPLAHGVSNRVGKLRGYGNAIVPQVGALFIRAFIDVESNYA